MAFASATWTRELPVIDAGKNRLGSARMHAATLRQLLARPVVKAAVAAVTRMSSFREVPDEARSPLPACHRFMLP
jgi:hypothetical protein